VAELSGDVEPDRGELEAADVICATPEKFGEFRPSEIQVAYCHCTV
jgi:hypothetical protein